MKIVVVGAGASGLIAAINAARDNNEVIILEHTKKLGSKIKVTGNGKCNLSNLSTDETKYNNKEFAKTVLEKVSVKDTIEFFYERGLTVREKDGYLYPMSEQAANVVNVLFNEIQRLKVSIIYDYHIHKIEKDANGFVIIGNDKIKCDKVIIATGGKSAAKTGSDGTGYKLAIELGHRVNKPLPGLAAMICNDSFFKEVSGVRVKAEISIYSKGELLHKEKGELQLTDFGVSGIPAFNCCRHIAFALHKKEDVTCIIDFLPEMSKKDIEKFLKLQIDKGNEELFALNGLLNSKLSCAILKRKEQLGINIVECIKYFKANVVKTKSFDNAQVTCGGVDVSEICPDTMESLLIKDLYFAGEIIDIDGECGGYNLQFAWSSGTIAGKSC